MELAAFVAGSGVDYIPVDQSPTRLSYLQRNKEDSTTLTIFLHGLGLDAYDYLPYLKRHEGQGIAVTLHGFDQYHREELEPAPLETHARLVSSLIAELHRKHFDKRIILVGFSLGADLILRLSEFWRDHQGEAVPLDTVVLLDPNVNHSTMMISSIFAKADRDALGPAVKQLIAKLPDSNSGLITTICEYIGRIGVKDFSHIRKLSQDVADYWQKTGYGQFNRRLMLVKEFARSVRVALSGDYQRHFPHLKEAADGYGPDLTIDILPEAEHFDLISSEFLDRQLRPLLDDGVQHKLAGHSAARSF